MTFLMKLTSTGAAKIAAAGAGGDPVQLAEMAVGNGGGVAVALPTGDETDLVGEVWRSALTSLSTSLIDPSVLIAESVIPTDQGGWTVREIGVFDLDGDLFAYGNFPETYKPVALEGSSREMVIQASIRVASTANVEIVVDPSLILATRMWCDGRFLQIGANLSDVADAAAALANLGGAPLASPVFTGVPQAPTADPGTNSLQIANTAFVAAALAALVDSSPAALDTLNDLAAALGDDPNFATTITNALALKAPLASPVFTGNPTAPTPDAADNDTSIATTAWTRAHVAGALAADGWAQIGSTLALSGSAVTFANIPTTGYSDLLIEILGMQVAATATIVLRLSDDGVSYSPDHGAGILQSIFLAENVGSAQRLHGGIKIPGFRRRAGIIDWALNDLQSDRTVSTISDSPAAGWRILNGISHVRLQTSASNFNGGTAVLWGR